MLFADAVKDRRLQLPIVQSGRFKVGLFNRLDDFILLANEIDTVIDIPDVHVDPSFIKNVLRQFVAGLKRVIEFYLAGNPARAYLEFERVMNNDLKDFSGILKMQRVDVGENFYRIRIKKENYPLEQKEMFHIPFERRGSVATQRFSIPGYPSLYLSSSLYAAWEEMRRPAINEFQACRLRNNASLVVLDLTAPEMAVELTQAVYRYFMTWPLVACCSVKVAHPEDAFKPEYIVPQLLLQWIRNKQEIDGVRYNSTHISSINNGSEGDFSNYVFPVKEDADSGHCVKLKEIFRMTQPFSWQLFELALGAQVFLDRRQPEKKKVKRLEIIKGRVFPYHYSTLGKLENYLDGMEDTVIN
jgi:hypothetical protein